MKHANYKYRIIFIYFIYACYVYLFFIFILLFGNEGLCLSKQSFCHVLNVNDSWDRVYCFLLESEKVAVFNMASYLYREFCNHIYLGQWEFARACAFNLMKTNEYSEEVKLTVSSTIQSLAKNPYLAKYVFYFIINDWIKLHKSFSLYIPEEEEKSERWFKLFLSLYKNNIKDFWYNYWWKWIEKCVCGSKISGANFVRNRVFKFILKLYSGAKLHFEKFRDSDTHNSRY